VVDPQRDIDQYVRDARRLGVRIAHVFLTHFHADFLAGHLELRDREGAAIYLGATAQAEYDFVAVGDGDTVELGPEVRLEVLETPGHSPESISILVYDRTNGEAPHAVLTGDTLFIGDVGRPDLRASLGWSAQELGALLYDSLRDKLLPLPDATLVYPAHGAGSLCGRNLSTDTVSTIGAQRSFNYALQPMSRDEFVRIVTADQPDTPAYFTYDAVLNSKERPTLDEALERELQPLSLERVLELQLEGAQILDTRDPADFEGAHLTGSVNVGLGGSYATWCGTLLDRERPIVLVADLGREQEAAVRLGRIGFDIVAGYLEGGLQALDARPELVARVERITAGALAEQLASQEPPLVLDVRTEREWGEGRIGDSLNIPLAALSERIHELPTDRATVVHCASGYRSAIAVSLLLRERFGDVVDLVGGLAAWESSTAELPAEHLVVWTPDPRNAETPLDLLCRSDVTPAELFFVRNHGPVPAVEAESYRLTLTGAVANPLVLSLRDLRGRWPRATVTATLACAGNRRGDLNQVAPVPNAIPWGAGAIGTAEWAGVRLSDVLSAAEVVPEAAHVVFTGLDEAEIASGLVAFEGSIPIDKALGSEVLLAYEMNGEPLSPEHGFPLRAVVPGYIGARSVKWLSTITVQPAPSASFFQTGDYTLDGTPLAELPLNSASCRPLEGEVVDGGTLLAEGYALAGGGRRVERVEVSADGGRSWHPAELAGGDEPWRWRLWRAELDDGEGVGELVVRAWDSEGAGQPEDPAATWNPRGYMNNAWHRVGFQARA
jgi:DMSO/TMAO reductase YedYZ molybdopterin-dependent catalytic subunit/glyoxylase-like metal-dependent hydrolase (beta-lactamase superfamily II)